MCTKWVVLDFDSDYFVSLLQSDSYVNSSTHKCFLKFPISDIIVFYSLKNLFLDFYSGETIALKIK